jgi:hypothetical protein
MKPSDPPLLADGNLRIKSCYIEKFTPKISMKIHPKRGILVDKMCVHKNSWKMSTKIHPLKMTTRIRPFWKKSVHENLLSTRILHPLIIRTIHFRLILKETNKKTRCKCDGLALCWMSSVIECLINVRASSTFAAVFYLHFCQTNVLFLFNLWWIQNYTLKTLGSNRAEIPTYVSLALYISKQATSTNAKENSFDIFSFWII